MGIFSSLFKKEKKEEQTGFSELEYEDEEVDAGPAVRSSGKLTEGMQLDVMTQEREFLLSGRVVEFDADNISLARKPGELSFKVCPVGSEVTLSGYDKYLIPICIRGTVEESTRTAFRVKDAKVENLVESRGTFRLPYRAPVSLYRQDDEHYRNPEDCQLVNISTGGCCVESDYVHMEDEVLRIRIKLEEYHPLNYMGQIVRCSEHNPGKFWYGILFAQLTEQEITELNKTLYNLQMGIKKTHQRQGPGLPGHW